MNSSLRLLDLTTSEGYLKRFGLICYLENYFDKQHTKQKLTDLIKKARYLRKDGKRGLTNLKVISRHFAILLRLHLFSETNIGINLTSDGKAIAKYLEVTKSIDTFCLSKFEKIFYLKKFYEYFNYELHYLLKILTIPMPFNTLTRHYFNLSKDGAIPRINTNFMSAFLQWSRSLGLVEYKNKKEIKLTDFGFNVKTRWGGDSYHFLNDVFAIKAKDVDLKLKLLDTLKKYSSDEKIVSFAPLRTIFCIDCLTEGIPINRDLADDILRALSKEKGFSINVDSSSRPAALF